MTSIRPPINVFLSYALEDEIYKEQLLDHLKNLERQGQIKTWNASQITAGSDWKTQRREQLKHAHIVLLLISPDAISDDYIYENEIQMALQNAESGKQIPMPILIRPVSYQGIGIEKYLVLPSNGKAVNEWGNSDRAYEHIVEHLEKIIEQGQALYAGDSIEILPKVEEELFLQNNSKSKFWQYLVSIGLIVGILAGIAQISGYDVKYFFSSSSNSSLTEPFDVTIFVHGEKGKQDLVLRQKGEVMMDFSGDRRSEPIDQDGKVIFHNIPIDKANDSVQFNIDFTEPYRPTHSHQKYALQPFTDVYLEIALQGLDKVYGTVLFEDAPLEGVVVSIGKLQVNTGKQGYYELHIPKELQRQKQKVQFYKEGFKLQTKTAYPQTGEGLPAIMERAK
ncbi:MAG: toll/interleukin-1 receptor domain-containing protein [Chitinophagales bacterium]